MSKELLIMHVYENYSKMFIYTDKADILESTKDKMFILFFLWASCAQLQAGRKNPVRYHLAPFQSLAVILNYLH